MKIVILFILIVSIILLSGCAEQEPYTYQEAPTYTIESNTLTNTKKLEICNDIKAYADWCYINEVSPDKCADQAVEKAMRLYNLDVNQMKAVFDYCQRMNILSQ